MNGTLGSFCLLGQFDKQTASCLFEDWKSAISSACVSAEAWGSSSRYVRENAIENIRNVLEKHVRVLGWCSAAESRIGRFEDKVIKNLSALRLTPGIEDICPKQQHSSAIRMFRPVGVVAAFIPRICPVSSTIALAISVLAGGNSLIIVPHDDTQVVTWKCTCLINYALQQCGQIPQHLMICMLKSGAQVYESIASDSRVAMVVQIGNAINREVKPETLTDRKDYGSSSRVLQVPVGNAAVLVDETADLSHAAGCIVAGASFDNNNLKTAERNVLVVESVANEFLHALEKIEEVHVLSEAELQCITKMLFGDQVAEFLENASQDWTRQDSFQVHCTGRRHFPTQAEIRDKLVGKDASVILQDLQMRQPVDRRLRLLVAWLGRHWVHPLLLNPLPLPILPIAVVQDVQAGLQVAIELEKPWGMSSFLYSNDAERIHEIASKAATNFLIHNASTVSQGELLRIPDSVVLGVGQLTPRCFVQERTIFLYDAAKKSKKS